MPRFSHAYTYPRSRVSPPVIAAVRHTRVDQAAIFSQYKRFSGRAKLLYRAAFPIAEVARDDVNR